MAKEKKVDAEQEVLDIITREKDGIYQNDIWKELEFDSRKCSRIIKKLLDADLVIREKAVYNGTQTYLLKAKAEEKEKNFEVLMVNDIFSPCTGCSGECRPEYCPALTFWVINLHDNPEELKNCFGYSDKSYADSGIESAEPEEQSEFSDEFGEEFSDEGEFEDEEY
ncbi:Lrp/AsnC family transcriptional regulator [Methanolapillus millepedarum]|uniref:B-block binding subunit of TFIIIC domain-containing protein n=1 Tax=Methanolapillus millepedarum TaxID=3028296 RepID=A0AA96V1N6_9EURY|nr:hypothetical protein MsAc7_03460 [Methanosarcinaceae archaeon Ac7]